MLAILYNIIISPIELVVEIVFELLFRLVGQHDSNQGLAVIGVSLTISLLTLPLYYRADAVQQKERDMQKRLSHWVKHIKKTFKGDERFMMLQAYYRENGYSPIMALNGSISLLLEIPFFIAAYHFLSNLEALKGASFGLIQDLGRADSLIKIGGLSINVLPILMTTINCISSAIYLKGFPLKDKIQTYGMALIFLVLLYNSPSGLVVYWTCNNLFSLAKNVFYKLKNPKKTAVILCAILGTLLTLAAFMSGQLNSRKKYFVMLLFQFIVLLPLFFYLTKNTNLVKRIENLFKKVSSDESKDTKGIFVLSSLFLTIITGLLIPASVIASSPAEFVDLQNYRNPLLFLVNSTCYALGFFILWASIIRYVVPKKSKSLFDFILFLFLGISFTDYLFFGKHMGVLSPLLTYTDGLAIKKSAKIVNLLCLFAASFIFLFAFRFKKIISFVLTVLLLSSSILSLSYIRQSQKALSDMAYIKELKASSDVLPLFTLSRKGKNVIVFMLDRAISGYVPYLLEEKPFLKEAFSGFTYYPNTLSHGFFTNFGTPAIFGGYEYTVSEMNKRDNEKLVDKHNEALKMLPAVFSSNGFDVTFCDPPYAGYEWVPDLSIFDSLPAVKAYHASGVTPNLDLLIHSQPNILREKNERNFFCYSVFKILPLFAGTIFYSKGSYFATKSHSYISQSFYNEISVLTQMEKLTDISNENKNTYLAFTNCATHEPCILQLPDYELKAEVDNSGFKTAADGKISMENEQQVSHYHVNMASFIALGKWFDFLRKQGVYDNTRIILVADHGRGLGQFDYMKMKELNLDVECCNPLLMVKDFNSKEFKTSSEFMTNADVPSLAVKNVIENAINPFTGNKIDDSEKYAHPQIVTSSCHWQTTKYNGNTFDTSDGHWYSVSDNIFKEENWKQLD